MFSSSSDIYSAAVVLTLWSLGSHSLLLGQSSTRLRLPSPQMVVEKLVDSMRPGEKINGCAQGLCS